MEIVWESAGRECLRLNLEMGGSGITGVSMECLGSLAFLRLSQEMKKQLSGPVEKLQLPSGSSPADLIWREVLQRIQGVWSFPAVSYTHLTLPTKA